MTQSHILILSIGPVQSFIAQARKTQDLFGGSRLLSHLCMEAISYAEKEGVEVIFPIVDKLQSIPNRFVGKVDGTAEKLRELGEDLEKYIQNTFLEIAHKVKGKYGIGNVTHFDEQIKQHLDINWIFYLIETNYETDYAEAEKWFGAAKNVRQFKQLPESGRKCSLDGERNVKVYRLNENEDEHKVLGIKKKLHQEKGSVFIAGNHSKIPLGLLESGEGLSAVSFVKRAFYFDQQSFPSTAEIALMDLFDELDGHFVLYKKLIGEQYFDHQLCYEENLNEDYFKKNGLEPVLKKVKMDCLLSVRKQLFEGKAASKYYALIVFDGDKMGEVISGKRLKEGSKHRLRDFQHETSQLLGEYAKRANEYLTQPKGRTVYAGGDDFMGFINLNYLYEAMQELRSQFEEQVNQKLKTIFVDDLEADFNFTFSAGVVIAHYKTPLSIVLKKARTMERLAKNEGDRNAFAISVIKHSGESHATVYKWEQLANIQGIGEQLQKENYSNAFIRNIQDEMSSLGVYRGMAFAKDGGLGETIAEFELGRLVERARMPGQPKGSMRKDIASIFEGTEEFSNFSQALDIAQFIKRHSTAKQ